MEKEADVLRISKKSLLYKIAYPEISDAFANKIPRTDTNICRFFPQIIIGLFVWWPLQIILTILMIEAFLILVAILSSFGFLFGYRLIVRGKDVALIGDKTKIFTPYKKWPCIFGIRPWPILVLLGVGMYFTRFWLLVAFTSVFFWVVTGIIALIFTAILLCLSFFNSSVYKLFRAWLRAKCTIIYFD